MPDVLLGRKPDGTLDEVRLDEDGNLTTTTELVQTDPIEVTIADQQTAVPDPGASGINVHIIPPGEVLPRELALTVTLPDDEPSRTVFMSTRQRGASDAGSLSSVSLNPDVKALHVSVERSVLPDGAADANRQDTTNSLLLGISDQLPTGLEGGRLAVETELGAAGNLATEAKQDDGIAATQAVELELQDKATEATLATRATEATTAATLAAVDTLEANTDQIESKLGTLVAQEATTAKDTSVDGLEALTTTANASLAAIESDADASRIAEQSIDAKTLSALGTDFATPVRGTATAAAAQLPSSSTPRGFTLENIDASSDLWVGTDNTVTTATGFRISPSRARFFDLGNPNTLWVISASTTAWQIGAVS